MTAHTRKGYRSYYISLPDSEVLELFDERPDLITGHQLLAQVCYKLNIREIDLFGLQHQPKPEAPIYWVNLRNKLSLEIGQKPIRIPHTAFYRFTLGVRYPVPPYILFSSGAKLLFYYYLKQKFFKNNYFLDLWEMKQLASFLVKIELPECVVSEEWYKNHYIPDNICYKWKIILHSYILYEHLEFINERDTMSNNSRCREQLITSMLDTYYKIPEYSRYWYDKLIITLGDVKIHGSIGICNYFIVLCDDHLEPVYRLANSHISKIQKTVKGELKIIYKENLYPLPNNQIIVTGQKGDISTDLYRMIAQYVCFYLFDMVTSEFKEKSIDVQDSCIYMYDISRTMCECYRHYASNLVSFDNWSHFMTSLFTINDRSLVEQRDSKYLAETLKRESILNLLKCKICLTDPVAFVFTDCGHAACCSNCGFKNIKFCPLCRQPLQWENIRPLRLIK